MVLKGTRGLSNLKRLFQSGRTSGHPLPGCGTSSVNSGVPSGPPRVTVTSHTPLSSVPTSVLLRTRDFFFKRTGTTFLSLVLCFVSYLDLLLDPWFLRQDLRSPSTTPITRVPTEIN